MTRLIYFPRVAILVALLSLLGCSVQPLEENPSNNIHDKKKQHALVMHEAWVGKSTIELLAVRGEPTSRLVLPPKNLTSCSAYIYEDQSDMGCMDSYVVQEESGMIIDYFCR